MRAPQYPWSAPFVLSGRPTVGALMGLCEENYRSLLRLIPHLKGIDGGLRSALDGGLDLHLEIMEQSPYTTLLRLTYLFPHDDGKIHRIPEPDPDALLRVYHDAGQVEVVDLRQTALPVHSHYQYPALEAKWKVNLFLSKWLTYCIRQGHRFPAASAQSDAVGPEGLLSTCL
ncbi:MAG: DUF1249 domain-containing protein [Pseudomonadota bacterium]|nr:DUF1249 domain-containing protein [Pseudomonadota bacterium]